MHKRGAVLSGFEEMPYGAKEEPAEQKLEDIKLNSNVEHLW